jgi:hypothetical protein
MEYATPHRIRLDAHRSYTISFSPVSLLGSRNHLTLLLSLLWLLSPVGGVYADPEADFISKRAAFGKSASTAALPVLKQQLTALLALERSAATARNYDAALATRDERRRVEAQVATLEKLQLLTTAQEKASQVTASIQLPLANATLSGTQLEAGSIVGWATSGATASWKLPNLPAGGYEVVIKYTSQPTEGGSLLVSEASYTLKATIGTTLKGSEELNLGTLKVTQGDGTLTLKALSVVGDNLMKLEAVQLLPAAQGTP